MKVPEMQQNELPINQVVEGDCLEGIKKLPDNSINCIMTSPPYWNLRDYGDETAKIWGGTAGCEHDWREIVVNNPNSAGNQGEASAVQHTNRGSSFNDYKDRTSHSDICSKCGAWKGQLGLEPAFEMYISHLCDIFDEAKRKMRDDGTLWVNLGDTYATHTSKRSAQFGTDIEEGNNSVFTKSRPRQTAPEKCLCQIPSRFAIEMVNRGWILRNEIIWYKRNCMPSSIDDRFTVDFEKIFFFVKKRKYWFERQLENIESVCTRKRKSAFRQQDESDDEMLTTVGRNKRTVWGVDEEEPRAVHMPPIGGVKKSDGFNRAYSGNTPFFNPDGRNKRCVWNVTTKPFREAHFATFPPELVETPIKAGCPKQICLKCGKPREKLYSKEIIKGKPSDRKVAEVNNVSPTSCFRTNNEVILKDLGYSDCGCNAGFRRGIALDPFMGSGTLGVVAAKEGVDFIGFDINPKYCEMARKRIAPFLQQKKIGDFHEPA